MSKAPQPSQQSRVAGMKSSRPGAPYPGASHPTATAAASSSGAQPSIPRLTVHNFATFPTRVKKLPPDANTSAATHMRLYQLPERVCFGCAKCRRDNIQSDSVAVDVRNKVILCTHCFTRIIRPRQYRPSRVVPFPSLLSWLNYSPSSASTVAEDVMERPAEAVAPSGERRAVPTLSRGDQPNAIARLPNIATNVVPTPGPGGRGHQRGNNNNKDSNSNSHNNARGAAAKGPAPTTHPCLRVWGVCLHGDLCRFRDAPADLCIAYLMGLCAGPHGETKAQGAPGQRGGRQRGRRGAHQSAVVSAVANEEGEGGESRGPTPSPGPRRACRLVHQDVYDLPNPMARSTRPAIRYPGDIDPNPHEGDEANADEDAELDEHTRAMRENRRLWLKWLEKRTNSPNSAEWQLWNNGPVRALFDQFVPVTQRPTPAGAPPVKAEEEVEEAPSTTVTEETTATAPAPAEGETKVKLNLADILSSLRGLD